MKLASLAVLATLVVAPALAQEYPETNTTAATTAPDPNVDSRVAAQDQARKNYYQHKLDAANAQTQADNARAQADQAAANRDMALNQAAQDRDEAEAAKQ